MRCITPPEVEQVGFPALPPLLSSFFLALSVSSPTLIFLSLSPLHSTSSPVVSFGNIAFLSDPCPPSASSVFPPQVTAATEYLFEIGALEANDATSPTTALGPLLNTLGVDLPIARMMILGKEQREGGREKGRRESVSHCVSVLLSWSGREKRGRKKGGGESLGEQEGMDGPGGLTFSGIPTRQDACWAWASRRSSWRQACAFLRCILFPSSLSAPASTFSFPHSACLPLRAHSSRLSPLTLLVLPVYFIVPLII